MLEFVVRLKTSNRFSKEHDRIPLNASKSWTVEILWYWEIDDWLIKEWTLRKINEVARVLE